MGVIHTTLVWTELSVTSLVLCPATTRKLDADRGQCPLLGRSRDGLCLILSHDLFEDHVIATRVLDPALDAD